MTLRHHLQDIPIRLILKFNFLNLKIKQRGFNKMIASEIQNHMIEANNDILNKQ